MNSLKYTFYFISYKYISIIFILRKVIQRKRLKLFFKADSMIISFILQSLKKIFHSQSTKLDRRFLFSI